MVVAWRRLRNLRNFAYKGVEKCWIMSGFLLYCIYSVHKYRIGPSNPIVLNRLSREVPMIGVVVWSSSEREKAVIWCEDHASLAYLQGRVDFAEAADWPEPGDLVELNSEIVGKLRFARQVRVLQDRACPDLPDMLNRAAETSAADQAQPKECHLRVVSRQEDVGPSRRASAAQGAPVRSLCAGH